MLITDKDPVLAARAVPLELIEPIALAIKRGYEKAQKYPYKRIVEISKLDELVYSDLTYSKKNCEWYSQFFDELVDITNVAGIFELPKVQISLRDIKTNSLFMVAPWYIHSPLLDEYYQELVNKNIDSYKQIPDLINLSRLMLFDLQPKFEDFVKGIPVWYTKFMEPLIEAYDQSNRRHIKIVKDGDRLRYMTSIISDRWEEIENVPPEMDVIIKYLISNRANLALTNEG